jgi:hypothetical protein
MTRPAYKFYPCKDHPGRNVAKHPCEICGWSPNIQAAPETIKQEVTLSLVASEETESSVIQAVDTKPIGETEIDTETGEITGQLILCGLELDTCEVQRRAQVPGISLDEWIAVYRGLEEGDKLTATRKDGLIVARVTAAWGRA